MVSTRRQQGRVAKTPSTAKPTRTSSPAKKNNSVAAPSVSAAAQKNVSYSFGDRLAQLGKYKAQLGDLLVPDSYKKYGLGVWVRNQRSKKKSNSLDSKKIEQLEEIGFVWEVKSKESADETWTKNFKSLLAYKRVRGDCNVSQNDANHVQLAGWVRRQRAKYKKLKERGGVQTDADKKLEEKMVALEEIGFVFSPCLFQSSFNLTCRGTLSKTCCSLPHNTPACEGTVNLSIPSAPCWAN